MIRWIFRIGLLAGCVPLTAVGAVGQEIVHAMIGTVSSINAAMKTIEVKTDDGSQNIFKEMTGTSTPIKFDKSIRTDSTAANEFQKSGVRVIVYYYGYGNNLTAVALRNLGTGPFTKLTGTVVKLEKATHSLSIKDQSGMVQSFTLTSDTIVETTMGAAGGLNFNPEKGDLVRINAVPENGVLKALFVNTLVAN